VEPNQNARFAVPVDYRSIVATRRGISALAAIGVAFAFTAIGFGIDALMGTELTATFSACYFLGCVAAVLAVRQRALFTAMVQPPLIMAAAVPIAAEVVSGSATTSLRDMLLNVAIPLVDRFPVMLAATVVVLMIGAFRWMTAKPGASAPAEPLRPTREPRAARRPAPPAERPARSRQGRRPEPEFGEADRSEIAYRPSDQTRARLEARRTQGRGEPRRQWGNAPRPALATPNRVRNDAPSHPVRVRYRDEPRG
jgi:hypothetical protein